MAEKEPQCDRQLILGIRSKEQVCKIWKGHKIIEENKKVLLSQDKMQRNKNVQMCINGL